MEISCHRRNEKTERTKASVGKSDLSSVHCGINTFKVISTIIPRLIRVLIKAMNICECRGSALMQSACMNDTFPYLATAASSLQRPVNITRDSDSPRASAFHVPRANPAQLAGPHTPTDII
ncbi:hypothetical protein AOLI_G00006320 [Acnodon oligacanthus]